MGQLPLTAAAHAAGCCLSTAAERVCVRTSLGEAGSCVLLSGRRRLYARPSAVRLGERHALAPATTYMYMYWLRTVLQC